MYNCLCNCHYQFGVSIMAICIDSQMKGFFQGVCMYTTSPFFEGAEPCALSVSTWLSFLLGCYEGYKAIPPLLVKVPLGR